MKLYVKPRCIKILDAIGCANQGEHNVTLCSFCFSDEFNGLEKKAVFTNLSTNKSYRVDLTDNECYIPCGAVSDTGECLIGVYAYLSNGEEVVKRFSPSPARVRVKSGSFPSCGGGDIVECPSQPKPPAIDNTQLEEINKRLDKLDNTIGEAIKNGGLKGDPGADGKSAYELAVERGYTGTLDEWLEDLQGEDGEDGEDGKSAYEIAKDKGFEGTEDEWLESIQNGSLLAPMSPDDFYEIWNRI